MNIIYDNTIYSLQRYGGVSRYFSELIKRIKGYNDVNVDIFKNLDVLPARLSRINEVLLNYKLFRHKGGLYHPTYYSSFVKKRKGVKTIVTVYDMIHELYLYKFKRFDSDIDVKKRSILNADHIICISAATRKDLMKIYNIKEEDASVIYLGVSLDDGGPGTSVFNKPRRPYILHVGKRGYYKNFNTLLSAFNALGLKKDFDLVCFGGERFSEEEIAEFKRFGMDDSVRYAEGDDRLLKDYYKNACIFIYPSLYEGFGFPLLEAMSNDCMVIASNGGSIPEVAGDAAMFFSPDKVDELCSCIKQVVNDSRLKDEYIKRGKERIRLFSWDKTAEETYNLYKKVLDGKIK